MNQFCNTLADTGTNTWIFIVTACGLVAFALILFVLISKKHRNHYNLFKSGGAAIILIFGIAAGISLAPVGHANAVADDQCVSTTNTSGSSSSGGGSSHVAIPALVDDSYSLGTNGGAILSVLTNDKPLSGDPFNATTLELVEPSGGGFYVTDTYTSINGESAAPDETSATHWQVINGKVVVTFGSTVPFNTPITIQYRVTSNNGLVPAQNATITVTRSSMAPVNAVTVSDIDLTTYNCVTHNGDTVDLLSGVNTSIGSINPLSIDLDPITAGRQTSVTDKSGNLVSVDSIGNLTYTGNVNVDDVLYFTVANSNGDTSGVGKILIDSFSHDCGG